MSIGQLSRNSKCLKLFFFPIKLTKLILLLIRSGGTLKIYGESLCRDVPYKTLLLSIRDCAQAVVREMLSKYGLDKADPLHYCLVQVNSDGTEYILDDDECPLSILMNHPTSRGKLHCYLCRPISYVFSSNRFAWIFCGVSSQKCSRANLIKCPNCLWAFWVLIHFGWLR